MPQMDGLEVLKRLKERDAAPPVVILSGHGTVKTAVEAVKLGAFDFIEKPPESERILIAARNALGQKRLVEENRRLKLVFDDRYRMVGRSAGAREGLGRGAPRRAHERDRAHHRRERGRQGAGGPRHPPQLARARTRRSSR